MMCVSPFGNVYPSPPPATSRGMPRNGSVGRDCCPATRLRPRSPGRTWKMTATIILTGCAPSTRSLTGVSVGTTS